MSTSVNSKVSGIATGDVLSDGSVPFTGAIASTVGTFTSSVANGAAAKAFSYNTPAYTTTAKLASWANNGAEKAYIGQDGSLIISGILEMIPGFSGYGLTVGGGGYVDGLRIQYAGSQIVGFASGKANFASNVVISFSSTTSQTGTPDTGFYRNAAGVIEFNNGTVGTFRDIKLRNLESSGGVIKRAVFTVATLPSAATSGHGAMAVVTDANTTLLLGLGTTVTAGGANKTPVGSDGTNWIYGG